ncbi:MAG TPA: hypothetical protein DER39_03420 [Porphyromonadaceae bacterium]|jgi:hypothetical protein|nr:hypothetical protein [Porphyromonadaceae bacterium]
MKSKAITLLLIVFLVSCSDFLTENPKSFLAPDNFYKTREDIEAGLNAVYRAPQDRYSSNWAAPHWFEWGTDICEITEKSSWAHHNEIARLPSTFNSSSTIPNDFWQYTYNHMKDANNLLKALPNVPISDEEKRLIEGQARALRALLYFDAVRVYNGVPLILEASTDLEFLKTVKRAIPEEVYNAIIQDLEFAMSVLPSKWDDVSDKGRITSGSAAALLAKVYLTMSGYPLNQKDKLQNAKAVLENFVDKKLFGGHYALFEDYASMFDDQLSPGSEGVWVINFTRGTFGQGNDFHTNFAPLELYYASGLGLTYGGGWSNGLPSDKFYNSYDKVNDKRFKHTYWSSTAEIPEEYDALVKKDEEGKPIHIEFYRPHVKKFREKTPNNNSQRTGLDHSIIRYADVLLMYAEVLNELNDNRKYEYINQVRRRAGLNDLSQLDQAEFREHLMLERAWELCFEGDRKFDLVRWGVYTSRTPEWNPQVVGNIKSNKHEFWPVPQSQIDINENLTQNPGW